MKRIFPAWVWSARSNRLSSLLLFTVIALAPLPFGSTDPTSIALWCIVLGVALAAARPRALKRGHFAILAGLAIIILAYAFVLHEQLSAPPWLAVPHPLWREAAEALQQPLEPSVSIARNQPFFALGAPLAVILCLMCSLIVCADSTRARQLVLVVAWSGVAYAAFGIASFLIDPSKILWREKQAYSTALTATFINRNTTAVYFGTASIVWLILLSERIRRLFPSGQFRWQRIVPTLSSRVPRRVIIACSMLMLCLAAMFMTSSRAGVVLSLVSLLVAFTLYFYRDLPSRRALAAAIIAGGLISLLVLQFFGARVSERIDLEGLADIGRFETYRSTLHMIAEHPWFGTGLGTFRWGYPAYRGSSVSMWGVWDRAHSTPLEIAAELGVPLACLVASGWVLALAILVNGAAVRGRQKATPVAAFAVASLALAHCMVDFSLQIPGYAIVVSALVGAGLAQAFDGRMPSRKQSQGRKQPE